MPSGDKEFSVEISSRTAFSNTEIGPVLNYTVNNYTHASFGGPLRASLTAYGTEAELWKLLNYIRAHITIRNEKSKKVWWGIIKSVEIRIGWLRVGISIENMYNKVTVLYTNFGDSKETDAASDSISVGEYGTKEIRLSLADATDGQASKKRDTELDQSKFPITTIDFDAQGQGDMSASIECMGIYDTLDWLYYKQEKGLEHYSQSGTGNLKIGLVYTASTISFDGTTISDSASGLSDFKKGDVFRVVNSSNNNGRHTVAQGSSEGGEITTACSLTTEASGTSITLESGNQIAQAFKQTSGSSWAAGSIQLRLQTSGSPDGYFVTRLYSSVSGSIGSFIVGGSILGASIPDTMTWTEIPLSASTTISNNTEYWIINAWSGSNVGAYYLVDLNEDLGYTSGSMQFQAASGLSFETRDPDADMLFKVTGTQETSQQIKEMIQSSGQFIDTADIAVNSGVNTNQYREGDNTAKAEIEKLLNAGTSNGLRMLCTVTPDRRFKLYEEPDPDFAEIYSLDSEKQLREPGGNPIELSSVTAGIWMSIADIIPKGADTSKISDVNRFFFEQVEYFPQTNRLLPTARRQTPVWETYEIKAG